MDNPETRTTLGARHRTKTKQNITQHRKPTKKKKQKKKREEKRGLQILLNFSRLLYIVPIFLYISAFS